MTIKKVVLASAFFSAIAAVNVHAGPYVGGQIGKAMTDIEDLNSSTAITAYGGFQIPDNPFFFEAAANELGQGKFEGSSVKVGSRGGSLMVGLRSPRTDSDRLSAYLKGGIYLLDTTFEAPDEKDESTSSNGAIIAAGFDYPIVSSLYLVGEVAGFIDVGYTDSFEEGVEVYSLGIRYEIE